MTSKLAIILATAAAFQVSALAAPLIKDTFKPSGSRAGGAALDGSATESGATWKASGNLVRAGEGASGVVASDTSKFVAALPLPEEGDIVRAEAKVRISQGAEGSESWIGIGMGNPDVAQGEIFWKTGILLFLDANGKYQSFAEFGKNKLYLKSAKIEGFDFEKTHTLRLEYSRTAGTLDFWVDDTKILEGFSLKAKNRTPESNFVGFSGYKPEANKLLVEEFSASVDTPLGE